MSVGKDYQRRTRMLILRAAMLKQQIHVKVNCIQKSLEYHLYFLSYCYAFL